MNDIKFVINSDFIIVTKDKSDGVLLEESVFGEKK